MFGPHLAGPGGGGGFGPQLPPDLRHLVGVDLRGPGLGGYGPDFLVLPTLGEADTFEPLVIPPALTPSVPWRRTDKRDLQPVMSWRIPDPAAVSPRIEFADGKGREKPASTPWRELQRQDLGARFRWTDTVPTESSVRKTWEVPRPTESRAPFDWRHGRTVEDSRAAWWRNPPIVDVLTRVPWGRLAVMDEAYSTRWPIPEIQDPHFRIPWGNGSQPQTLVDNPTIDEPVPPAPNPVPPIYIPPAGDAVALAFTCPLDEWPGSAVALPFRRFQCLRRAIVIDNDIVCRRIDTGETFECLELSVQGDIESHTDGFTARLPHGAESILTGPLEIELEINGIAFLMIMEQWADDAAFGADGRRDTFRVRGRSINAELDEPFSAPRSRFETETRTALQLMQQELPIDGSWTISAHPAFTDYTIPGETFSYTDLTPLRAISVIAAAVGAVVQQVPGERTLRIVPRYPVDPWKQATTPADVEVDFAMIRGNSGEFRPVALANGVYVAGEGPGGVLVQGKRTGTSGAPWLDIVTDPLITDPQAGLQRARAELGATGKRKVYQFELPLMTGETDPGLIRTGQLLNVIEDPETDWRAQATAWSLAGRWLDEAGLEIWHNVTGERYLDE